MKNQTASNLYDDLFKQVNNAAKYLDETLSGSKNPDFSNDCPTITISSLDTIFPKTVIRMQLLPSLVWKSPLL